MRYELIGCGLHGHELLGTDAAELRPEDALFAREAGGLRWYRCLRCDSWLPLPPPSAPTTPYPPDRAAVQPPLRGRPLRDRYVLRLIAVDRFIHVVLFGAAAILLFWFAGHHVDLQRFSVRLVNLFEGNATGTGNPNHGLVFTIQHFLDIKPSRAREIAIVATAYAVLEGIEMVGLWLAKRWAEYLTFIATIALVPFEVYEMTEKLTITRVAAFVINVAIVVYLGLAKRLFGLRGGGRYERAERERDTGWPAIERATPGTEVTPYEQARP